MERYVTAHIYGFEFVDVCRHGLLIRWSRVRILLIVRQKAGLWLMMI